MSEKNAKKERSKVIKFMTEEAGQNEVAREKAKSISKMYEDRDKKALGARDRLVSQLEITADKYRTANGVMAALHVVRDVLDKTTDFVEDISIAKRAATNMAGVALKMADKARGLDPDNMDQLCDDFYMKDFSESKASALEMIDELLILQLCQQVGPNAEDVAEFCHTADDEIEKARKDLMEHCEENNIDFNEICGPHDNCPDCLCMDCANDCKEGKDIEEGQSAYDVCEKFVKREE